MVSETPARPPGGPGVSPGPVQADEVFRIIRERLADILEIEESRITLEASFTEDLAADSLALIELVEAIEQELEDRAEGFRIEDEDLADLRTVRDAVDYVVERVG
jgi:acyl carrier protein